MADPFRVDVPNPIPRPDVEAELARIFGAPIPDALRPDKLIQQYPAYEAGDLASRLEDPRKLKEGLLGRASDLISQVGARLDPSLFRKQGERTRAMILSGILSGVGATGANQRQRARESQAQRNAAATEKYRAEEDAKRQLHTSIALKTAGLPLEAETQKRGFQAQEVLRKSARAEEYPMFVAQEKAKAQLGIQALQQEIQTKLEQGVLVARNGGLMTPEAAETLDLQQMSGEVMRRAQLFGLVPDEFLKRLDNIRTRRTQNLQYISGSSQYSRDPATQAIIRSLQEQNVILDTEERALKRGMLDNIKSRIQLVPAGEQEETLQLAETLYGELGTQEGLGNLRGMDPLQNEQGWHEATSEKRKAMVSAALDREFQSNDPDAILKSARFIMSRVKTDPTLMKDQQLLQKMQQLLQHYRQMGGVDPLNLPAE